jgi:hypothetical protein
MHGVNPDLLQTTPYRADGTARNPHAHHAAEHRAELRAARRARRQALVARAVHVLSRFLHTRSRAPSRQPQA